MNIIVEGFDRSGKDTYIRKLESFGYRVIPTPEKKRDLFATDKEAYRKFLLENFDETVTKLSENKSFVCNRFHISEYVFSQFFNRDRIFDTFDEIENKLTQSTIIQYLEIDYDTYLSRCDVTEAVIYTQLEFDEITRLFREALSKTNLLVVTLTQEQLCHILKSDTILTFD
jgi:thymidylate kinase